MPILLRPVAEPLYAFASKVAVSASEEPFSRARSIAVRWIASASLTSPTCATNRDRDARCSSSEKPSFMRAAMTSSMASVLPFQPSMFASSAARSWTCDCWSSR